MNHSFYKILISINYKIFTFEFPDNSSAKSGTTRWGGHAAALHGTILTQRVRVSHFFFARDGLLTFPHPHTHRATKRTIFYNDPAPELVSCFSRIHAWIYGNSAPEIEEDASENTQKLVNRNGPPRVVVIYVPQAIRELSRGRSFRLCCNMAHPQRHTDSDATGKQNSWSGWRYLADISIHPKGVENWISKGNSSLIRLFRPHVDFDSTKTKINQHKVNAKSTINFEAFFLRET